MGGGGGGRGVLMLFEAAQQPFARDNEAFHNPKLTKVEVTIEGESTLFSGLEALSNVGQGEEILRRRQ